VVLLSYGARAGDEGGIERRGIDPCARLVTYDIAGYFLEFDWFYEDDKNTKISDYLN